MAGLFLVNREKIHNSIESVRRQMEIRNGAPNAAGGSEEADEGPAQAVPEQAAPEPAHTEPVAGNAPALPPELPQTPAEPQAPAASQSRPAEPVAAAGPPVQAGGTPPATAKPQTPQARPTAPETRERTLYFTQVDRAGDILRVKAQRKLPVSNSPMTDSLSALINGPNTDELKRDFISLIPKETRVLNATVRGSTAYISLSEDFQLNTHGVEGYAASLRQIVWTVTEFPNVEDVQILIEGRRLDYLGEGIWIGSPLNRETVP
jgi:hypothetical protein